MYWTEESCHCSHIPYNCLDCSGNQKQAKQLNIENVQIKVDWSFPHCSPVAAVSVEPGWVNCMTRHYLRTNVPQRPTETFVWCSLMERDASLCECGQRLTDWMWRKQTLHGRYLTMGLSVASAHFCFITVPFSASLNICLSHVDDWPQVMYFTVT